jgi:hypothetical protein
MSIEKQIQNAENLDQLIEVLIKSDGLHSTVGFQPPETLRLRIEQVRNGHRTLEFITRTAGLKRRVEELLPTDHKYLKNLRRKRGC